MQIDHNLDGLISRHLQMMDEILKSTRKMLDFAVNQETEKVTEESQNRERMINIVAHLQNQIDQALRSYADTRVPEEIKKRLAGWSKLFNIKNSIINKEDEKIINLLEKSKKDTTQEIKKNSKNKKSIKGYNLNNTKRA